MRRVRSSRAHPRRPAARSAMPMRDRLAVLAALVAALVVAPAAAHAVVTYKIKGGVVASGGGWGFNATQGSVGTAGQPVTGYSSKLYFSVCSGFWCFGGTRVIGVDDDGGTGSGGSPGSSLPKELSFGAPSPNPSRGDVRFALALPKEADVTFVVYDVAGRQIGEPVERHLGAGYHQLLWSAPSDHSGVYFGLLRVDGEFKGERRIVLVR
jgi:hypothetical protein